MQYSDLVADIKKGGTSHDRALGQLYNDASLRAQVFGYLVKKGMTQADAQTIWTDAVVQFGKLVLDGKYEDQDNLPGYLMNLARYLLLNQIRSNKRYQYVDLEDIDQSSTGVEDVTVYTNEIKALFEGILALLGESCSRILSLWSRGYSMEEIRAKMSVVSNEAIRKRKHSCLKKLLDSVDANPTLKNQLEEYVLNQ